MLSDTERIIKHNYHRNKFFAAISQNNLSELKDLLLLSAKDSLYKFSWINCADSDNVTLLHYAVMCGHLNIVKFLIDNGARIDTATKSQNRTPLHSAYCSYNIDIINLLCNAPTPAKVTRDKYGFELGHSYRIHSVIHSSMLPPLTLKPVNKYVSTNLGISNLI